MSFWEYMMDRLGPTSIIWFCRYAGPVSMVAIGVLSLVPAALRPHVFASGQLEHFVAYFVAALNACHPRANGCLLGGKSIGNRAGSRPPLIASH
jgi:hypothetical protein